MSEKLPYIVRTAVLVILLALTVFLCIAELFKIQIVDGDTYSAKSELTYVAKQNVEAARGQIVDINGAKLNTNRSVYKVVIQRSFCPAGKENATIAKTIDIFILNGEKWIDSIPISMEAPFDFTVSGDELDAFQEKLGVNYDATAENCLDFLFDEYDIGEDFPPQMRRYIAGVRYEMKLRDFSYENRYTMAEDVGLKTIVELKERWNELPGIDIVEETMRMYALPETAPHLRGVISHISQDMYEKKKKDGYRLNDLIGSFGIESAVEDKLRGTDGIREIVRDSNGAAVSDEITQTAQPGNSVKLTIDSDFQDTLQQILKDHLEWYRVNHTSFPGKRKGAAVSGSVVVLNPKTGAILAMASYPAYDLNVYKEDYSSVLNAENNPLLNRTIFGEYRPGSTFKTITASTALIDGVITRNDTVVCGGTYTYFPPPFRPKCTGTHGRVDVTEALKWSCNIFFYDVGRRAGIERLDVIAARFGIGTDLELEIGGSTGRMTSPELTEKLTGKEYTAGNTVQAAIGQSETMVTPLHLAVQAMTLANDGMRYKPYLVDSVWDYDCTQMLAKTQPVIAEDFRAGNEHTFSVVREGMIKVSTLVDWPIGSGKNHFDGLPDNIALKTGSPETGTYRGPNDQIYNSAVMGYYPAHDPQIAFGVMIEDSDFSRYMVRNIIDAYFYHNYEPSVSADGIVNMPWKRWIGQKEPTETEKTDTSGTENTAEEASEFAESGTD